MQQQDGASSSSTVIPEDRHWVRPRRKTDSAVTPRQADFRPELPGRAIGSPSWTASPTSISPLTTTNLSIPALAERPSQRFRREVACGEKSPRASQELFCAAAAPRDPAPKQPALNPSTTTDIIEALPIATTPTPSNTSHIQVPQSRFDFEFHLPLRRRALTSHDSSNIATSTVRHPTLTSQRGFLYDSPRRLIAAFDLSNLPKASSQPLSESLTTEKSSSSSRVDAVRTGNALSPNAPKRRKQSGLISQRAIRPDVNIEMPSTMTYLESSPLANESNRARNGAGRPGEEESSKASTAEDSRSKTEDIFLNIAKSDSNRRDSLGRSEPRRSRFGFSSHALRSSTARINTEQTPSPDQFRFNNPETPLHLHNGSPSIPYSSVANSPSASAHPLDEQTRHRYFGASAGSRSTVGVPRSRLSRTSPETSPGSPETNVQRRASLHESRLYRQSTLSTIRNSRQPSTSEATERAPLDSERARPDGTESTLSTTAPSTVWDELEDLKSRIRKLELTGKLPASSQAAISNASGERPRTATTTVTTLSSSPKHGRKASFPSADSEAATIVNQIYPLLNSALAKANGTVSKEVFKALEATVADALTLSNLLGCSTAPPGSASVVNGFGSPERQVRRKADSLCRSLTELCLALSDQQVHRRPASRDKDLGAQQPNSSEGEPLTPTVTYPRSASHEPEGLSRQPSAKRLSSRLEARRASLANITTNTGPRPLQDLKATDSSSVSTPSTRLHRLSTSLRTRRLQTEDDNLGQGNLPSRSVSRAMTEIGTSVPANRISSQLSQQQVSHDYTTVTTPHAISDPQDGQAKDFSPQPQQQRTSQPRTPTLSLSGIPFRRSLMTQSTYTPLASNFNVQPGSRRYGFSSSASSAVGERFTAKSIVDGKGPQPEPSQTRIVAPSSKLAGSYTPIQQRVRTNSLGSKRFGIRQRPVTTSGDTLDASSDNGMH